MMIRHRFMSVVVTVAGLAVVAALVVSCGGGAAAPTEAPTQAPEATTAPTQAPEATTAPVQAAEPTEAPTQAPEPTAAPTEVPQPTAAPPAAESSGGPTTVDLDAIFPPGRGKELSLMGCTGCHSFVPLVIVQFNADEWERNALDHRERVSAMSDEDYQILYDYLTENFGPDDPVPELPQELLDQWTSY